MSTPGRTAFGDALRERRLAALLSQEALAARAGLSVDAIKALERGRRAVPRLETVALLAEALGLTASERAAFVAAAVAGGRAEPGTPTSPVATISSSSAVLPAPPSVMIGREREQAAVMQLVREEGVRLLTLTGPGGVGKTRLALAVAAALRDDFPDGVAFVDLAALRDPALLLPTVSRALGVREAGAQDVHDLLLAYLQPRQLLVVLDNVEQVVTAAPLLAELVLACPRLVALVTSRTALRVRGEQQFPVAPLPTPDPAHDRSLDHVAAAAAVQLFLARAQAALPAFQLDAQNAEVIARICARLDGLPLALELAASWITVLPPAALLQRLERRLTVLTGGPRDLPVRQRTLRDTIEWSHDLLTAPERCLFARLAVFRGGGTLEAIEAVCDPDGALDALAGVEALIEKNLLRHEAGGSEPRLVMLETIHEYARERLEASGEEPELRRRHAAYVLALAERAEPELTGNAQGAWLARLEREHDNLRAALRWAEENGEVALGLRLAASLWRFWQLHGHLSEGRRWLERLLARDDVDDMDEEGDDGAALATRAHALAGAGWLAHRQTDFDWAAKRLEESVALYRALGRTASMAGVLINRALVAHAQGDYARAVPVLEEALALYRAEGNQAGIGEALFRLALLTRERGDYARARALYDDCLAVHRALGDRAGIAVALLGLGDIARDRGEPAGVETFCGESLALFREVGDRWGIACSLNNLGLAAWQRGDPAQAVALLEESLGLFRELGIGGSIAEELVGLGRVVGAQGHGERAEALLAEGLRLALAEGPRWLVAAGLEGLATLAAERGQAERAAVMLGEAAALRGVMGTPLWPVDQASHDRIVTTLRAMLGAEAFATAWAAGAALPPEQAVAAALGKGPGPRRAGDDPG